MHPPIPMSAAAAAPVAAAASAPAATAAAPRAAPARAARPVALAGLLAALLLCAAPGARAATPAELLAGYSAEAGSAPQPLRGQQFFSAPHGRDWTCATCHGTPPTQVGKHAATAKPIAALAPAANPERFSDPAKVEKWFRRNCNDVLGRACSAGEKADLLAWLVTLKP